MSEETTYNYMEELKIDPNDLDNEWINQPTLYMKYAKLKNEKLQEVNDLKENYNVKKAEIGMESRKPIDGKKPTQGQVDDLVNSNQELHELAKEINEEKRNCDDFNSAVIAFDHKKKALENMVTLEVYSLNSEPKQRNGNVEERMKRRNNENG